MKNIDIENLLEKYSNGSISKEELHRLESMTHRDEVMRSAKGMAIEIRRKRWRKVSYVSMAIVLVCGVGLLMRPLMIDENEIQIVKMEKSPIPVETVKVDKSTPLAEVEVKNERRVEVKTVGNNSAVEVDEEPMKVVKPKEEAVVIEELEPLKYESMQCDNEPQVLCNVQCDADSVISEVWNFLKA